MLKGILITVGIIIAFIIIIKLSTRNRDKYVGYSEGGLRGSLDSIRKKFDDVCKKIGIRSGC